MYFLGYFQSFHCIGVGEDLNKGEAASFIENRSLGMGDEKKSVSALSNSGMVFGGNATTSKIFVSRNTS